MTKTKPTTSTNHRLLPLPRGGYKGVLAGRRAMLIGDDEMAPRYCRGEVVHLDWSAPVRRGDHVAIMLRDGRRWIVRRVVAADH